MRIDVEIPIVLPTPNISEHWSSRSRRNKKHAAIIKYMVGSQIKDVELPCEIYLTRIAKRLYDSDNNIFAFKSTRDTLAQLITGKKRGIGDEDGFTWHYAQEKGVESKVKITIIWGKSEK